MSKDTVSELTDLELGLLGMAITWYKQSHSMPEATYAYRKVREYYSGELDINDLYTEVEEEFEKRLKKERNE